MKLIVDSNIVFSAILNPGSRIARILLSQHKYFNLYSCHYLHEEIKHHYDKLSKLAGKSVDWVIDTEKHVTKHISFINESIIPEGDFKTEEKLVKEVYFDDVVFVALSIHLNAKLWTGDKRITACLLRQNFTEVVNTQQLLSIIDNIEKSP